LLYKINENYVIEECVINLFDNFFRFIKMGMVILLV